MDRTAHGAKGSGTSKRRMKKAATVVTDVLTLGRLFETGRVRSQKRGPDASGIGVAYLHAMPPSPKNFPNDDFQIPQSGDGGPDIPPYHPHISPIVKTGHATPSSNIHDELKSAVLKAERNLQDSNDKREIKGEHEGKRERKRHADQDTPASTSRVQKASDVTSLGQHFLVQMDMEVSKGGDEKRVQKAPVPLSCEICSKKFTRAYNLRAYLRTHPAERPVKCGVCSEAFTHDKDLRRHKRAVHIGAYATRLFQSEFSLPFSGESGIQDRESDNIQIPPGDARPGVYIMKVQISHISIVQRLGKITCMTRQIQRSKRSRTLLETPPCDLNKVLLIPRQTHDHHRSKPHRPLR